MKTIRTGVLSIGILMTTGALFSQPSYMPVGPQTNVSISTVEGGGWTECYRSFYGQSTGEDLVALLAACDGPELMLACLPIEAQGGPGGSLRLLAAAPRADVLFDTGQNSDELHTANGSGWYFNAGAHCADGKGLGSSSSSATGGNGSDGCAWGFVAQGDPVDKSNCDVLEGPTGDQRLCWHLQTGSGGYRCGETQGLNASQSWAKVVYVSTEPVPTTSTRQLVLLGVFLLALGALATRRWALGS